jgi:hypothetical protein
MSLNIGNESIDENLDVILSSVNKLLVTLGGTLNFLGQSLNQVDVNDRQIRGHILEQLELQLNLLEPTFIEFMEQQKIFLQKQIDKMSIN